MNDGRPSTEVLPLNIGYLATYLKANLINQCEIKLFNDPYELESETERVVPDILASSNYIWNFRLNYFFLSHYKTRYPGIVTVMGGPNIPGNERDQEVFLKKYHDIDFYIYGEGELSFCALVEKLVNSDLDIQKLKKDRIEGGLYLYDEQLVNNGRSRRFRNLDDMPSPYLQGLFDKFLRKGYVPLLQTTRGCPFSCTYCYCGSDYYNKVESFAANRISDEIDYICQRAKARTLQIADSNFGMMSKDYEICLKLNDTIKRYNWPVGINLATSKVNKKKVLECLSLLGGTVNFSASMQSLNEDTLREIKRKNLTFDEYRRIQNDNMSMQTRSSCEMIIPLPEETKDSYLLGVRAGIDANMDIIDTYTCMMLKNTELRDTFYIKRFKMETKHRIVSRDFGRYLGKYVIETEEVCVETSTMTFSEYIYLRGFNFILSTHYNLKSMKEIIKYLRVKDVSVYPCLKEIYESLIISDGPAGRILKSFINDATSELWDSEEELLEYYNQENNFQKLVNGKDGANLIQKYQAIFMNHIKEFIDHAVLIISKYLQHAELEALDNLKKYCISLQSNIFDASKDKIRDSFTFDIIAWIKDGFEKDINNYRSNISLIFIMSEEQRKILNDSFLLYGFNDDGKGKILTRINPELLIRNVKYA
jgi:radical SAM superfamily enzyme YgiQ (UPF0313 family)